MAKIYSTLNGNLVEVIGKNMKAFKKAYEDCEDEGDFKFMNGEFYKGYAKYLIEYIEGKNAKD